MQENSLVIIFVYAPWPEDESVIFLYTPCSYPSTSAIDEKFFFGKNIQTKKDLSVYLMAMSEDSMELRRRL